MKELLEEIGKMFGNHNDKFFKAWRKFMQEFEDLKTNVNNLTSAIASVSDSSNQALAMLADVKAQLAAAAQGGLAPADVKAVSDQVSGAVASLGHIKTAIDNDLNPPQAAAEAPAPGPAPGAETGPAQAAPAT